MDKVNTERLCSCPAAEEESKVVKEAQGSRNKGQEGRKRLEESRKIDTVHVRSDSVNVMVDIVDLTS